MHLIDEVMPTTGTTPVVGKDIVDCNQFSGAKPNETPADAHHRITLSN